MTDRELLEKAIYWFKVIADDMEHITSGNLPHCAATTKGRAIRAYDFLEKHKEDNPVSWHKQEDDDIYDTFNDWSYHRFVCLMKDGSIQVFIGMCDEHDDGMVEKHINCSTNDHFCMDDIFMWIEVPQVSV